jgi:hypothetical protein
MRNKDGLLASSQLGEQCRGLALQCCDEFGSHKGNTIVALWSLQAPSRPNLIRIAVTRESRDQTEATQLEMVKGKVSDQ